MAEQLTSRPDTAPEATLCNQEQQALREGVEIRLNLIPNGTAFTGVKQLFEYEKASRSLRPISRAVDASGVGVKVLFEHVVMHI